MASFFEDIYDSFSLGACILALGEKKYYLKTGKEYDTLCSERRLQLSLPLSINTLLRILQPSVPGTESPEHPLMHPQCTRWKA